jgi:hypothetical protein
MTSKQSDTDYADRVVREAMVAATGGLDADRVAAAVTDIVAAVGRMGAVLKDAPFKPGDYEKIARSMARAMKTADGIYRLVEFAAGRPDSRPDKATDWLRGLTDDQLRIVQGWVDENGRREATMQAANAVQHDAGAERGTVRRSHE